MHTTSEEKPSRELLNIYSGQTQQLLSAVERREKVMPGVKQQKKDGFLLRQQHPAKNILTLLLHFLLSFPHLPCF